MMSKLFKGKLPAMAEKTLLHKGGPADSPENPTRGIMLHACCVVVPKQYMHIDVCRCM